jgi:hypothetical protein
MKLRTIIAVAAMVLAVGMNVWLAYRELSPNQEGRNGIAPSEVTVRHTVRDNDPLFDLQYASARRGTNFEAYGMPPAMVERASDRAALFAEDYGRKVELMMRDSEDPQRLLDAICGENSEQRPRYAMLRYLVEQQGAERGPIDFKRANSLEQGEWAVLSGIDEVYETLEFADDRKDDATLMGVAAIMAGQEEKVAKAQAPWGRGGIRRSWDWDRVVSDHPGLDVRVVEYFAMMHVVTEFAHGPTGICTN